MAANSLPVPAFPSQLRCNYRRFNRALVEKYVSYLRYVKTSPTNTVLTYGRLLHEFVDVLGAQSILAAKHGDLLVCLGALCDRGWSKSSIALSVYALRSLHKFISRMGWPHTADLRLLRVPKTPQRIAEHH